MKELIEIQKLLKAPKNQFNKFGNYNYRNCEDILESVKPLLDTNKCILTITDDIIEVGGRIYVKAIATITNANNLSISVSAFAREPEKQAGMAESQITGAASSYARKYALNGLFLIDDTKDTDTQNDSDKETKKPILEIGTENFIQCKKAYLANPKVLPKIMAKYEVSNEVHFALTAE